MLDPEAMFDHSSNRRNGLLNFDLGPGMNPDQSASLNTRVDKEKRLVLMFQMMKRNQDQSMSLGLSLHIIFLDSNPLRASLRTRSGFTPRMLTLCSAYLGALRWDYVQVI